MPPCYAATVFQDLFFFPLDRGVETRWDRALVLGILNKGAVESVTYDLCRYPDGSGGHVDGIDPGDTRDHLDYLHFDRFGGRTMTVRIFELADALDTYLVWSGVGADEPNACVARIERLERVEAEARNAAMFAVARDASHLSWLVKGHFFGENGR